MPAALDDGAKIRALAEPAGDVFASLKALKAIFGGLKLFASVGRRALMSFELRLRAGNEALVLFDGRGVQVMDRIPEPLVVLEALLLNGPDVPPASPSGWRPCRRRPSGARRGAEGRGCPRRGQALPDLWPRRRPWIGARPRRRLTRARRYAPHAPSRPRVGPERGWPEGGSPEGGIERTCCGKVARELAFATLSCHYAEGGTK